MVLRLKYQTRSLVSTLDCNELVPSGVASMQNLSGECSRTSRRVQHVLRNHVEVSMLDGKPRTQAMSVPKQQPSSLSFVSMAGWSTNSSCPAALPFMVHILLYLSPSDYKTDSQVFWLPALQWRLNNTRAVMLSYFGEAFSVDLLYSHIVMQLNLKSGTARTYLGSYILNLELFSKYYDFGSSGC